MSERYNVDWPSVQRVFPPGFEPPPLLRDFARWVDDLPWGSVGWFSLIGRLPDDAAIGDGALLRDRFALFLHLPDGSEAGFWLYPGLDLAEPPVVYLGSEGEAVVLADSLRAFLAKLVQGGFGSKGPWASLEGDAPDKLRELRAWLGNRPDTAGTALPAAQRPATPDFGAVMAAWQTEREAYWASHPSMARLALLLAAYYPTGGNPWDSTIFRAEIVGALYRLTVLHGGPQPVPEAAAVEPVLRALREEQWKASPGLGLWYGMDFGLRADGSIWPTFDYQNRPPVASEPEGIAQGRADLARAPRPARWVPGWLA